MTRSKAAVLRMTAPELPGPAPFRGPDSGALNTNSSRSLQRANVISDRRSALCSSFDRGWFRRIPNLGLLVACLGGGVGAGPIGCAITRGPAPSAIAIPEDAGDLEQRADWDDIRAGVLVGAERIEWTVLDKREVSPTRHEFTLLAPDDAQADVVVERDDGDLSGPVVVRVRCWIRPFRDPAREARLLESIGARLDALRGVRFRRIGV